MAKAKRKTSTAWPPDGLPLAKALPLILPDAWAAYSTATREVIRAAGTVQPDDESRLVDGHKLATVQLMFELHALLEREPSYEMWGRTYLLIEPARRIPAVAIRPSSSLRTLDPHSGEAKGPGGLALFDLRIRRARPALPAAPNKEELQDPKAWFAEARKQLPQRRGEMPFDYAKRLHAVMQTAPVSKVWRLETLRRRLYDRTK